MWDNLKGKAKSFHTTELPAMMGRVSVRTGQCGGHQPQGAIKPLKCGQCDGGTEFLIAFNFN